MEVVEPLTPVINITIRGLRKDASTVHPIAVNAGVDLSLAEFGRRTFRITPDQIILPNEQVNVVRIHPDEITFEFKQKQREPAPAPSSYSIRL